MEEVRDLENALPNGVSPTVHVEVCQRQFSTAKVSIIEDHVIKLLSKKPLLSILDMTIRHFDDPFLQEHVSSVTLCDSDMSVMDRKEFNLARLATQVHVYRLNEGGPAQEELDDEDLAAANHWLLPSDEFCGLWESLIFDFEIKNQLLQYARSTLLFSDRKVDSNIISWNRVILLHGPPGTGKTSLCRALAQKLCIQLNSRYAYGQLIEINSHSLFSKWFSESGKLVLKMFQRIQEFIDDQEALVCVLIDEVESLTAARKAALNGSEPSDSIRVVNALLTQLDQIKKYPNVIILTTSNITGAIDLAFVDRADIKQYIGPPTPAAIYKIYQTCIKELMDTKIIQPVERVMELRELDVTGSGDSCFIDKSSKLKLIAMKSEGLSGRTLRKLPFIAHAVYIQKPCITLIQFLEALDNAVIRQFKELEDLTKD